MSRFEPDWWSGRSRLAETSRAIAAAQEIRPRSLRIEGCVIEWDAPPTNMILGLSDLPPQRRIARVSHVREDGRLVCFDPDGIRCILEPEQVRVIAEHAGWGRLA